MIYTTAWLNSDWSEGRDKTLWNVCAGKGLGGAAQRQNQKITTHEIIFLKRHVPQCLISLIPQQPTITIFNLLMNTFIRLICETS